MEVEVNGVVYESEAATHVCNGCIARYDRSLCSDITESVSCRGIIWLENEIKQPTNDLVQGTTPSTKEEKELLVEPSKGVKKHNHYFKDVSNLEVIDVYRVLDLFGVTNPCLQHAIKKLLVAGNRGVKDYNKDVQEAIDTLERYKVMQEENKKE